MKYLREHGSIILIVLAGALLVYKLFSGGTHPLTGKMAPDFQMPLLNGQPVSLADHRGKEVVVLDFWASWCPPCRESLPLLDQVAREHTGQPVAIYAVNIREGRELVSEFSKVNKLSLPILLDDTGLVSDDYGVSEIPQTVIIDRAGRIHTIHTGLSMWGFRDSLDADIQAAIAAGSTSP